MKKYLGLFFVFLWLTGPLLGTFIPFLGLDERTTGLLVSFFLFGGSSIFLLIGIVFIGKSGILYYKDKVINTYASRKRYYFGLTLTIIAFASNWILAYLYVMKLISIQEDSSLYITLGIDLMGVFGIVIMGPEFLRKIKAIGHYQGKPE